MTSPTKRRPLPALIFLLALCLLAALVWWRVLHRDSGASPAKSSCPSPTAAAARTVLPQPSAVTVRVLNSTNRRGIAHTVTVALGQDGFHTVAESNDTDPAKYGSHGVIPQAAEIRYGPKAAAAARLLAYYFPGAKLVARSSQDSTVLVSLGTRFGQLPAKTTVDAKLKAAGISTAPVPSGSAGAPSPSASC